MAQHRSLPDGSWNTPSSPPRLTATCRLLAILVVVVSLVGGPVTNVQAATTITFTGAELLSRPTDASIMITIVPASTIEYYYEYGTAPGAYTAQTDLATATGGQPGKVVIDELEANTQYYYRMKYHLPGETDWVTRTEHSFWTQRTKDSTFTFTVTSDSHVGMQGLAPTPAVFTQSMTNVSTDQPDFHIDLGDTFAMDAVTTVSGAESAYLARRTQFDLVGNSAAIFIAPGNHEEQEGWNFDDSPSQSILSINAQKKFYPDPIPDAFYAGNPDALAAIEGDHLREDYYAWTWGDALFIVFDPFQYTMKIPYSPSAGPGEENDEGTPTNDRWTWTLGRQQYDWLKQTLENSNARFKFMFAHHMLGGTQLYVRGGAAPAHMFEWGGYNSDGSTWGWTTRRPGWGDDPIRQLMIDNNVSAFFHGHDHQYGYEMRDGIVYQEVPSAGFTGQGFNFYTTGSGYCIKASNSPGHLRITITPSLATVDYIASGTSDGSVTPTVNGAVKYSYTIEPAPILTTTVSPPEGGTIAPAAGAHDYGKDTVVSVTAAPAGGYIFDHWGGDCTGSDACQVTMDEDKSVTANFMVSPDVAITSGDNHPTLTWQHQVVAVDHYEVHRSLTAPYFAPDAGSWLADAPTSMPAFTDDDPGTGANLSLAGAMYFYAVVPVNASEDPIGSSNRTGAFVFGLIPGAGS